MEEWRRVSTERGYYSVSNLGRVRNDTTSRILSKDLGTGDYWFIRLGAYEKNKKVAVLVAEAFIGPRPNGHEINHKDGNKLNDRPENLEWVTHQENGLHSWRIGTHKAVPNYGVKNGNSVLDSSKVKHIRELYATGLHSHKSLGKMFDVDATTIGQIVNRKTWQNV